MDLKERILAYMREEAYKPLLAGDLAEAMQLTPEEQVGFPQALEALEQEGAIIRNRSDLYGTPARMHLVVGKLSMTAKGFGFIIPDVRETEEETDVFVPGVSLNSAMHGDRVVARVTPSQEPGRSREGEIIRVLERANERIVGTYESSRTFGFVTPDNTKLNNDIFIPKKAAHGAKTGAKVVVEITKWPTGRHNAEGKVTEIIGMKGDPGVDILSVMKQYDLSETFPEDVQAAATACEENPSPEEYAGRRDRRDLSIVTIDGDDSKDLDDGVYAKKNADGSYFLGVYIADVSWYVRENEPLDREARERGTSVYLVDRVIPMLPKELSNGICSLNAGVDRLSMACEMQISPEGEVTSYEIVPTVIHVHRRLTYNIVNKVLVDHEEPYVSDNADIREMLETLRDLRDILKAKRHRRGSIDFEIPEVKVKLDAEGHPIALIKRVGSLSESIVEECMLAANETVARHMDTKHLPFMYRVHEQPSEEKLERLNNVLAAFGLFVRSDEMGHVKPMDIQKVLAKVEGKPEERLLSTVALRSMQQASYSPESLGHFGLAARYYTHFTSPIRRYPDLIVHRLLRETFATGTMPGARQEKLRSLLPEIADHASERERVAIEAERETTDMKKIEYMAQFVGEEFHGIISGVTAFGIFVELDNGVEGLVHVSTMVNDFYEYKEEQFAMVGERTQQRYRLGDEVDILLVRANIEERNLDFVLKDNGAYDPKAMANAVRGGRKPGKPQGGRDDKEKKERGGRRGERGGRRERKSEGGSSILAEAFLDAKAHEGEPKHHRNGKGKGRRGPSGEKLPHRDDHHRPAERKNSTGFGRKDEKRDRDDYHHVRVTGLNKAVWPDPPGYHERKQRQEAMQAEKPRKQAPQRARHGHSKTEGSTGNAKH
ncbi:MAG: ribonuclease R [Selenomonadaceae bacterium]|nr:ribonuclease R [Selenomonadaceae bacterium]